MMLRGVAHVVNYGRGIASETKQYLKEKKESNNSKNQDENDDQSSENANDEDWELDDALEDTDSRRESLPSYEQTQAEQPLDRVVR